MMKINDDILKSKQKITRSINAYGFSPEHNYYNYLYTQNAGKRGVFLDFGKARGIVAFYNKEKKIWRIINGVLAPEQERFEIFKSFLDWALKEEDSSKVFAEFQEDFKSELFKKLRKSFKLNICYCLHWPIIDLDNLDDKLSGKDWKKLRNIRNRFLSQYKIETKNPKAVVKEALNNILMSWTKRRFPRDRANYGYYLNAINNNFEGIDSLRAVCLNGEVCSFSGGWKIPNSENFYSSIGIFNYKYKYLGDFLNLDDLLHIKKLGYKFVDLGGSERSLLNFKKKFNPIKIYKTYFFSIAPQK